MTNKNLVPLQLLVAAVVISSCAITIFAQRQTFKMDIRDSLYTKKYSYRVIEKDDQRIMIISPRRLEMFNEQSENLEIPVYLLNITTVDEIRVKKVKVTDEKGETIATVDEDVTAGTVSEISTDPEEIMTMFAKDDTSQGDENKIVSKSGVLDKAVKRVLRVDLRDRAKRVDKIKLKFSVEM